MTATLPELTLPQMLRERAKSDAARVAIRQKDFGIWKPFTWADYHRRASAFGLGLAALGVPTGGHVGVLSENRIEWVLAQMGAGLIGAVTVGVYPTSPSSEVAYVVGHADISVMVCEDQEQTDKLLQARANLPALRKIVVMETKGLRSFTPEERALIIPFAEVEQLGAASLAQATIDAALAAQTLDDIGLIIYTSGSTGKPKGAMLSWRNIRGVVPGIVERLQLHRDSSHLSSCRSSTGLLSQIPSMRIDCSAASPSSFLKGSDFHHGNGRGPSGGRWARAGAALSRSAATTRRSRSGNIIVLPL